MCDYTLLPSLNSGIKRATKSLDWDLRVWTEVISVEMSAQHRKNRGLTEKNAGLEMKWLMPI